MAHRINGQPSCEQHIAKELPFTILLTSGKTKTKVKETKENGRVKTRVFDGSDASYSFGPRPGEQGRWVAATPSNSKINKFPWWKQIHFSQSEQSRQRYICIHIHMYTQKTKKCEVYKSFRVIMTSKSSNTRCWISCFNTIEFPKEIISKNKNRKQN